MTFTVRKSRNPHDWLPWQLRRKSNLGSGTIVRCFLSHDEAMDYLDLMSATWRNRRRLTV